MAERSIELRDSRSLRVVARLRNRAGDDDRWVRFSPDGRLLAVSSIAGYTQLWDVASREPVGPPLRGHEFDMYNAEFSPDGRLLATSGFNGTVILWDVESRRAVGTLAGRHAPVSARLTPDGRRLFTLHDTGEAQRWEVSPDAWSHQRPLACEGELVDRARSPWARPPPA